MTEQTKIEFIQNIKQLFEHIKALSEAAGIQSISIAIIEGSAIIMPTIYDHKEAAFVLRALLEEIENPKAMSGAIINPHTGRSFISQSKELTDGK